MRAQTNTILAALILAFTLSACGEDDSGDTSTATSTSYTFATDIAPIVTRSCGGSTCHSTGGQSPDLTNKANFIAYSSKIISRIGDSNKPMPPTTSDKTLAAGDKTILTNYLSQSTRD